MSIQDAIDSRISVHLGRMTQPRWAIVSAVDPAKHLVKVQIQPGGKDSGWIPDATLAAGSAMIMTPSDVGTQVLVVHGEGDSDYPIVVARLFDAVMTPPTSYATGKPVQAGEVGVILRDGTTLHVTPGTVFIKANLSVTGSIVATGDVTAGMVTLQTHTHPYQPGSGAQVQTGIGVG